MSATQALKDRVEFKITIGNILTIIMIIGGAIFTYATSQSQNDSTKAQLAIHMTDQRSDLAKFVLKDVQDTRNKFIDQELSSIDKHLESIDKNISILLVQAKYAR